jgi:hypothetical protein
MYVIIKSKNQEDDFVKLCETMYEKSKTEPVFCAIDFEYNNHINKRYIGLAQIIFDKDVYILDLLKSIQKEKIIKYIFCSKIIKIFHGSDSLDYPHIYESLIKDNDKFIDFINHSVDTLFLCNLYQNLTNKLGLTNNKKCNIYDALYSAKIIDTNKFESLVKLCKKINYNKNWYVNNLTETQLEYSANDVIYSIKLFKKLVMLINNNNIVSLINKIYRLHILLKLKIFDDKTINKKNSFRDIRNNIIYDDKEYGVIITIDDLLNITPIRKTIFYLLNNETNKNIRLLKGYELILKFFF